MSSVTVAKLRNVNLSLQWWAVCAQSGLQVADVSFERIVSKLKGTSLLTFLVIKL